MAYPVNPQSVVEIQALGRLHGQRTRNIFHYLYRGATIITDGKAEIQALALDFHNQVTTQMLTRLSEEYTLEGIQAQWIAPIRYRSALHPVNAVGQVAVGSVPSGVAVVIRRTAERSGRHFQGRVYIPGLPISHEDDSTVDPAMRAAWNAFGQTFLIPLAGPEGGANYSMVVSTDIAVTVDDLVASVALDPVLRYQRRREIGVGE